jgi:hypothetical protein
MCQPLLDSRFRGNERKVFGFYVPTSPNCGLDGSACARLGIASSTKVSFSARGTRGLHFRCSKMLACNGGTRSCGR